MEIPSLVHNFLLFYNPVAMKLSSMKGFISLVASVLFMVIHSLFKCENTGFQIDPFTRLILTGPINMFWNEFM